MQYTNNILDLLVTISYNIQQRLRKSADDKNMQIYHFAQHAKSYSSFFGYLQAIDTSTFFIIFPYRFWSVWKFNFKGRRITYRPVANEIAGSISRLRQGKYNKTEARVRTCFRLFQSKLPTFVFLKKCLFNFHWRPNKQGIAIKSGYCNQTEACTSVCYRLLLSKLPTIVFLNCLFNCLWRCPNKQGIAIKTDGWYAPACATVYCYQSYRLYMFVLSF